LAERKSVALVVPTFRRPQFLYRFLLYYSRLEPIFTIYIADSTPLSELEENRLVVAEFQGKLRVHHHHVPDKNPLSATREVLRFVTEDYVCWSADDDYQVPSGVSECVSFLEKHPDFNSARGELALIFSMDGTNCFGEIKSASLYDRPSSLVAETATQRLRDFLLNYFVLVFCVHRTSSFRTCVEGVEQIPHHLITEFLFGAHSAVLGKCKVLPGVVSLIRQDHIARGNYQRFFDTLIEPLFQESYRIFVEKTAQALSVADQISPAESLKLTRLALVEYFKKRAKADLGMTSQPLRFPAFLSGIKVPLKQILRLFSRKDRLLDIHYFFGPKSPFPTDVAHFQRLIAVPPEVSREKGDFRAQVRPIDL
jgi:glycosyltransferase domain-containing protein